MQEPTTPGSPREQHFPVGNVSDDHLRQALQVMTTEHSALRSGRASTIAEANGRVTVFLTTASSTLIALAFIGQISALGDAFRVFTLLLLPALLVLGVFTLGRVVQSGAEDTLYVSGINRIRHFYAEVVPEVADYFVLSTHDDQAGWLASMGIQRSRWQPFFGIGSMVGVINSIVVGTLCALISAWFAAAPLLLSVAIGVLATALFTALQFRVATAASNRAEAGRKVLFPTRG